MLLGFVKSMDRWTKRLILILLDAFSTLVALLLAWWLVLGSLPGEQDSTYLLTLGAILLTVTVAMVVMLGLHKIKLNTYEIKGIVENSTIAIVIGLAGGLYNHVAGAVLPPQVFVILAMSYAILAIGLRLALKTWVIGLYALGRDRKRVLIYGAGQTGQQLSVALQTDDAFAAVGFVDDNPALQGMVINGLKVASPVQIREVIREKEVDRVVIAIPSASHGTRAAITRRLSDIGCQVHSMPSIAELVVDVGNPGPTRRIDVAALLG
ncbi:MAG TPA: polysaccharide biosynthesis protein, partial [Aliiroseovarius sp.]|nr:polysaccharide biosynthesis protein [Aliiroseovarius sp.]